MNKARTQLEELRKEWKMNCVMRIKVQASTTKKEMEATTSTEELNESCRQSRNFLQMNQSQLWGKQKRKCHRCWERNRQWIDIHAWMKEEEAKAKPKVIWNGDLQIIPKDGVECRWIKDNDDRTTLEHGANGSRRRLKKLGYWCHQRPKDDIPRSV